jgi:calcium-dependent protein kinase
MIDTDNSGQITFEELKVGLKKVGANLKESEIYDLMQAVSIFIRTCYKNRKKQVVLVR